MKLFCWTYVLWAPCMEWVYQPAWSSTLSKEPKSQYNPVDPKCERRLDIEITTTATTYHLVLLWST